MKKVTKKIVLCFCMLFGIILATNTKSNAATTYTAKWDVNNVYYEPTVNRHYFTPVYPSGNVNSGVLLCRYDIKNGKAGNLIFGTFYDPEFLDATSSSKEETIKSELRQKFGNETSVISNTSISIPAFLKNGDGYNCPVDSIAVHAFYFTDIIKSELMIPRNVSEIGKDALYGGRAKDSLWNTDRGTFFTTVTMPAYFWEKFYTYGVSPYAELKNNGFQPEIKLSTDSFVYNGNVQHPLVEVYNYYYTGEEWKLRTVPATSNPELSASCDAGKYTFNCTIIDSVETGICNVSSSRFGSATYTISPFSMENVILESGIAESYSYTGSKICPVPQISAPWGIISEEDYTVSYEDNINAGTASLYCSGKNQNLTGTFTKIFTIEPINIGNASIDLEQNEYTYDGTVIEPAVNLIWNDRKLEIDKDFSISYSGNINVGEAMVTITGIGNFCNTVLKPFSIKALTITEDNTTVAPLADKYLYTGKPINPVPVVQCGTDILTVGKDFEFSYSDNTNEGTATLTITGIGNYSGMLTRNFQISNEPTMMGENAESSSYNNIQKTSESVEDNKLVISNKESGQTVNGKKAGKEKKTLTWKKVKKASRYVIYKRNGKKLKKIKIVKGTITKINVTVAKGSLNQYRIIAQKKIGKKWIKIKAFSRTLKGRE